MFSDAIDYLDAITKKEKEIVEGKTPFEREEGPIVIYFWRILAIVIIGTSCGAIAISVRTIYAIMRQWTTIENIFLLPIVILCFLGVLLLSGEIIFKLVAKRDLPYEFGVVTKPLVVGFLVITTIVGALALAMLKQH